MNTLFNKVLGENEICVFYFYLKLKEPFGQPNIIPLQFNNKKIINPIKMGKKCEEKFYSGKYMNRISTEKRFLISLFIIRET